MWQTNGTPSVRSLCNISTIPIDDFTKCVRTDSDKLYPSLVHEEVEQYVRKSGGRIIARKGATFYAIAISVCHICRCITCGTDTTLTVSSMMHGEYGIDDVCLSTLSLVGKDGITGKVILPLTDGEIALLKKSADSLKAVISQLKF